MLTYHQTSTIINIYNGANYMNPWDIIAEIESLSGRLDKEAVVRSAAEDANDTFFKGVEMATSAYITFGVKKVPIKTDDTGSDLNWDTFLFLANELEHRSLTGHAARDAIEACMRQATMDQWNNWYRRILIKDLRCGMTNGTINRVCKKDFPKYVVPVFECMLAQPNEKFPKKMVGEKMIEVKLDGARVLTIVDPINNTVTQYTRNGKQLVNFGHICDQLLSVIDFFAEPIVLDGEIMSSSFQDLMKQIKRQSNVDTEDAVLNLFDIVTLREFKAGKSDHDQRRRTFTLQEIFKIIRIGDKDALPNINVLEHEIVNLSTGAGKARFKEINKQAIEEGFEGLMIKDMDAPYVCKRSPSWLKMKPFVEVSLTITDTVIGTGKNDGRLGNILCEGVDDGKFIQVSVGSGLSEAQRDEFWADRDSLVGQVIEVRADAVTQDQSGGSYSLRFPRFLRFRGFEVGEKI